MTSFRLDPAVAADAAAVAEVIVALETSLYGQSLFSQADLEDEWLDLDVEQDARVVRDGDRIVGYGAVRQEGERWDAEAYVHPETLGRGIGKLIATGLEEHAASRGARRILTRAFDVDAAARRLLQSLGYGAVRVFREMRIELETPPPAPKWPHGLRAVPFDPERDGARVPRRGRGGVRGSLGVHPARVRVVVEELPWQQAFRPDAVVRRSGQDDIAAGTICAGDTYGGGWGCTRSSRVARGASTASARRSWATRSRASGARRAQHRARRRCGERDRCVPPLRARWDVCQARLGDLREGSRPLCAELRA